MINFIQAGDVEDISCTLSVTDTTKRYRVSAFPGITIIDHKYIFVKDGGWEEIWIPMQLQLTDPPPKG